MRAGTTRRDASIEADPTRFSSAHPLLERLDLYFTVGSLFICPCFLRQRLGITYEVGLQKSFRDSSDEIARVSAFIALDTKLIHLSWFAAV
jgi:hypothetical protein